MQTTLLAVVVLKQALAPRQVLPLPLTPLASINTDRGIVVNGSLAGERKKTEALLSWPVVWFTSAR